jgi:uncharacterized protein YuzB (UPF0349 family)
MENKSIKDEIEKEVDDFTQALIERDKQALRYNQGKVQWSLVDYKSIEPMVRVLEYGCLKYSKNNWKKGMPVSQIIESMLRHTYKLLEGELVDPESGIEHVGHIQCNAMFLAYVLREKPEYNDLA